MTTLDLGRTYEEYLVNVETSRGQLNWITELNKDEWLRAKTCSICPDREACVSRGDCGEHGADL